MQRLTKEERAELADLHNPRSANFLNRNKVSQQSPNVLAQEPNLIPPKNRKIRNRNQIRGSFSTQ